jgi:hypothetical protein
MHTNWNVIRQQNDASFAETRRRQAQQQAETTEAQAKENSRLNREADDVARAERLNEDRVIIAGLCGLLLDIRRSPRFVQELGLLVSVAADGEPEITRAHRALDTILRTAEKLSPMIPAVAILQVREHVEWLQLHLSLAAHSRG